MRDHSRLAIQLMANITNPEIIERLATCDLYRWRTNVIFGIMCWSTWRFVQFDLLDFADNACIAEGQYIGNCIGQTCCRVQDLMDQLFEEEEEEREEEWLRRVRYLREVRILTRAGDDACVGYSSKQVCRTERLEGAHFVSIDFEDLCYFTTGEYANGSKYSYKPTTDLQNLLKSQERTSHKKVKKVERNIVFLTWNSKLEEDTLALLGLDWFSQPNVKLLDL
ncbi:hypothetical protein F52700_3447 [Fusarium sp. NRRL 52700]|nr:hypothetical protein F52700_3447 [Fusarium sp. NRRL 52700]